MSKGNLIFSPASKVQEAFLNDNSSWLKIYGGAAFAGKSICLLGSHLPIISDPGTRALIVRRTTKNISGSGGLFDAAVDLFKKVDPKLKIRSRDLILEFSSGAQIAFSYLDKPGDKYNFQGKEFSRVCVDEAQQLSEDNVFYLLSRLRSTRVSYPKQAFMTCNPDPDSFLFKFVEHSLDEYLVPDPEIAQKTRYFAREGGKLVFFDTAEDAELALPTPKGETPSYKSYTFYAANIYQNPIGLALNRDYISTLEALPITERKRLLDGAWVREMKSGFFKREWCNYVDFPNMAARKRVRAWDLAFSEPSEARPRVDATAGVLMSKDEKTSVYTVENVITLRKRVHEVEQMIFQTAERDGQNVIISLPKDPGATAGAYCRDLSRRLSEKGFTVRLTSPDKGKLQRFNPFASVAQAGFVQIVKSEWTPDYLNELEQTEFTHKTHDDQADATSDAFYHLARASSLMPFTPLEMTSASNQFGLQSTSLPSDMAASLPFN